VAGPGLLAQILVSKYADHLPLYRQEQIFAQRHKINLPRVTLARWVELCADWLQPIYEQIRTGVMAGGYAQVDETPVAYLAPGNGQTKQGYLWTACRPAATSSIAGKPAAPPNAWNALFQASSKACCIRRLLGLRRLH
jgi:transposase